MDAWCAVDRDGHVGAFTPLGDGAAAPVSRDDVDDPDFWIRLNEVALRSARTRRVYDLEREIRVRRDRGEILDGAPDEDALHQGREGGRLVLAFASSREAAAAAGFRDILRATRGVAVFTDADGDLDELHARRACLACFWHDADEEDGEREFEDSVFSYAAAPLAYISENRIAWPYRREGAPRHPFFSRDLPELWRESVERVRFDSLCFADAASIQPLEHVACDSGMSILYLSADRMRLLTVPGREEDWRRSGATLRSALPAELARLLPEAFTPGPGAQPLA